MKKKREKFNTPEHVKLKIPLEYKCNDEKIQNLIEKLGETDCFEVQQQIIAEVSWKLNSKCIHCINLNLSARIVFTQWKSRRQPAVYNKIDHICIFNIKS